MCVVVFARLTGVPSAETCMFSLIVAAFSEQIYIFTSQVRKQYFPLLYPATLLQQCNGTKENGEKLKVTEGLNSSMTKLLVHTL